jgi:hypothetical protein
MGEPPKPVPGPPPKRPWVAAFATRLCVIAWSAAILTELLPPSGIESLCILVGTQACVIGLLTCMLVGLRFRSGVLFLVFIATSAPATYFALVLRQLARIKGWIH